LKGAERHSMSETVSRARTGAGKYARIRQGLKRATRRSLAPWTYGRPDVLTSCGQPDACFRGVEAQPKADGRLQLGAMWPDGGGLGRRILGVIRNPPFYHRKTQKNPPRPLAGGPESGCFPRGNGLFCSEKGPCWWRGLWREKSGENVKNRREAAGWVGFWCKTGLFSRGNDVFAQRAVRRRRVTQSSTDGFLPARRSLPLRRDDRGNDHAGDFAAWQQEPAL
jgi:hypothetical protein